MTAEVRVVELAETGSTNADAMRLAQAGEKLPLWVRADRQTAGRGRAGRTWLGAEGALLASIAIRLHCDSRNAAQLSLVAGTALADAIRAATGDVGRLPVELKWPNDVMIGGAKAGGILVETSGRSGDLLAVVGFGLNLAAAPAIDRPAAALSALGRLLQPMEFLAFLAPSMQHWLKVWDQDGGFAAVRDAWSSRACAIGTAITVDRGQGRESGVFAGLDADGALLFTDVSGRTARVTFGDVTILGAEPGQEKAARGE